MNEVTSSIPDDLDEMPAPRPLVQRPGPDANLLIRGADLLDPAAGVSGTHDLLIEDGVIARVADPGSIEPGEGGAGWAEMPGDARDPLLELVTLLRECAGVDADD